MGQGGDGQESSSASGEGGSQGETAKKMIDLTDCLTDSPRFRCVANASSRRVVISRAGLVNARC